MGKNIHVTHRKDGPWAVIGEGDNRASSLHETQREAIEAGRSMTSPAAILLISNSGKILTLADDTNVDMKNSI